MMRILFVEPSSGFGGSGNSLTSLLRHLDKNRFKPILVTFQEGPQFDKARRFAVEIITFDSKEFETKNRGGALPYFKFGLDILFNILPISLKLIFIIHKYKIDLVHINTNIISGIPAILAAKISRVPSICCIRQTRRLIRREKFFVPWIERFVVTNFKAKEIYSNDIKEERLSLIYNGLDLEDYNNGHDREALRKDLNLDSSPVVGLVGRIVKGKGQKEFIMSAKEVLKTKPDVKFVIVGAAKGGDDRYYKEAKELVKKENLEKNIIFTGWRNDTKDIISELNILVQGSTTFPEGFGLTIIEAMALRKPVIATDIPGPQDIVVDGETGFLVPPGDAKVMAEKIICLLDNPEAAKKMGEKGRREVEEKFDIRATSEKIQELYLTVEGKR